VTCVTNLCQGATRSAPIIEAIRYWQDHPERLEDWLETRIQEDPTTWSRVPARVKDVFRHWFRIGRRIERWVPRRPKRDLNLVLRVFLTEIEVSADAVGKGPVIVDNGVTIARRLGCSKPEQGFINRLLRKGLKVKIGEISGEPDDGLPDWLRDRWRLAFGTDAVAAYARQISARPPNYCFSYEPVGEATGIPNFHRWSAAHREEVLHAVAKGQAYIQDPFTRHAVALLGVEQGNRVLDLCAAPGGKSWHILHQLAGTGHLRGTWPQVRFDDIDVDAALARDGMIRVSGDVAREARKWGAALDVIVETQRAGDVATMIAANRCVPLGTLSRPNSSTPRK